MSIDTIDTIELAAKAVRLTKYNYTAAIILAAGSSTRMGLNVNKQFERLRGIPVLAHTLKAYENCPVILAGDFNCTNSSEPYQKYVAAGFSDVHDIAEVKDNARGYYDGPYWDEGPDIPYMTMGTSFGNFSDAIDHMITKGSGIEFKTYDSLCDNASASISDHMPVVSDFNFSK
jgi:endonuclease/exonuclease/phosphatase family metal-dependent hydrolase